MEEVPFDSESWAWGTARPARTEHRGRECIRLETSTATVTGADLADGALELDLAVAPERGFHGVVWRLRDEESFESFFVRPHQVGNPDAVQYTPVFNDVSGWQLYHGPGFWAPVSFPLGDWFRIRVVFAGERAEVFVGDPDQPVLAIRELKRPAEPGRVGILAGGPAIHVSRFAYTAEPPSFRAAAPPRAPADEGVVPVWWVSDPFPEATVAGAASLDPGLAGQRGWTRLESEPGGLADLARVNGIRNGRNTVLARTTIRSDRARIAPLELGFSDRAVVFLDGRALYRGDDTYRSRDYRFLGSIGWHDTVYLPLEEGEHELVVAVSETFGGWGVQARFTDRTGITLG